MEQSELLLRLGLALAIGFLIGLERGWHERDEKEGHRTAGIRTFSLIGLLGGVFGALSLGGDRVLITAGFITVGASLAAFMWREGEHDEDFSATSLVAALLTFMLGSFALLGDIRAVSGAGVAAVILLANKEFLHGWLTRLTWPELRSGLLLAAMSFILLPLLPDRTVDPWNVLNPHQLWLMTILIAAVSFAGYAAVKIAGPERGLLLAAGLGGLFASTAVTLSLARLAPANRGRLSLLAAGILAAGLVMLLRVILITGLINLQLARTLLPALLPAIAVMAAFAALLIWFDHGAAVRNGKELILKNPFELLQVLRFGALLSLVVLAVALARQEFGDAGLLSLAALSGLADVDAMTLSVARLQEVSPVMTNAVLLTIAVNSLAKCIYAWIGGGSRIGFLSMLATALALAAGAQTAFGWSN